MSKVLNTSEGANNSPLGSFAGIGSALGRINHSISRYFDEHGFVIACLSIVPTPTYSQLLPKHMIAPSSPLDYYSPEFGKIGMVPITYEEVAPIQMYSISHSRFDLLRTFGYQRPWYDLLRSVDEVHGHFRTTLRDYLLNREFDAPPELSRSFIKVDPNQLNDVFSYRGNDDKFLGQIVFKITAKRPIPSSSMPSLGY